MKLKQYPLFRAITENNVVDQLEMVIARPDGGRRKVLIYPRLLRRGADICGGTAHLVDITSKDEKDTRHAFLSSIVASSDDAIISKDLNGIITSWNKGAQQIFGYTEEEALGKPITILISKERLDEETHILSRIKAGQKVNHFQTVRLAKSGEEIAISLSVSPVRNNEGRIIGASKIARDITNQVKAETAIRLYASNLEAINSIGKSIAKKLDVSKIMQYVADSTTELTGAAFGAFFYETHNEEGNPVTLKAFSGLNLLAWDGMPTTPTARDIGTLNMRHRGVASYLQVPVFSPDDEVVGELFLGHPLPGKFHGHHEELVASIAAQAAIALDNSKMFEEVKALSRKKDEFIALASHELKTPLTSLGGFLQIVAKKNADPLSRRFIDKAVNQVTKLNKLVTDLLDAARLENNKLPFNREAFDCRQLVMDVIEDFRYAHPENSIHFNEPAEEITVIGDKQRIEQVLVNLLDNAVKYSSGEHAVYVRLAHDERYKDYDKG